MSLLLALLSQAVEPPPVEPEKAAGSTTAKPRVIKSRPAWIVQEPLAPSVSADDEEDALLLCGVL